MWVKDINGNTFSTIMQTRRNMSCSTWLDIYDGFVSEEQTGSSAHALSIERPCLQFGPNCICDTVEFPIHTGDGVGKDIAVGRLANVWPGCNAKGCLTKADNYTMEFPKEMLVGHKLALLGSALLIDYMFFEQSSNNNNNNHSTYYGGGPMSIEMSR